MHIVLISNYAPPYQGGIQFIMAELCKRFVAEGHQVTIIACDTGIARGITQSSNASNIGVPALNFLERYSIPYPVFNPVSLIRVLRDVLPTADVVHLHGSMYMDCAIAAWMARRRGIRVVLTEHVGTIKDGRLMLDLAQKFMFNTLGRICCQNSQIVVTYNSRVEAEVRAITPGDTPVIEIRNGVDTVLFKPASNVQREALRQKWGFLKPTVLFAGRLVRKKGVNLLLDAASATDQFELVICGKGKLTATLPANVRQIGLVDQDDLSELYKAADIFALVSQGEGFPLVVQEALASGLPVVVSDELVNYEYLDQSVAVFVKASAQQVLAALLDLVADEARRRRMVLDGREWALSHFDWNQTAKAYLSVYMPADAESSI